MLLEADSKFPTEYHHAHLKVTIIHFNIIIPRGKTALGDAVISIRQSAETTRVLSMLLKQDCTLSNQPSTLQQINVHGPVRRFSGQIH
jgi:hypothetical protein